MGQTERKDQEGERRCTRGKDIYKKNTTYSSSFLFINTDDKKRKEKGKGNDKGQTERKKTEKGRKKKYLCKIHINITQ